LRLSPTEVWLAGFVMMMTMGLPGQLVAPGGTFCVDSHAGERRYAPDEYQRGKNFNLSAPGSGIAKANVGPAKGNFPHIGFRRARNHHGQK
jgi:hypothetical protein